MASSAIHAHAFLVCLSVAWDGTPGPNTSRTLERVSYVYRTDTPDGFPFQTDFWLFVRLGHRRRQGVAKTLYLTLVWHDDPELRPEAWTRRFPDVSVRPEVTVRDIAARAAGVFEGPGRYEFRLWYRSVRTWDQTVRRRVVARTFIRIEG